MKRPGLIPVAAVLLVLCGILAVIGTLIGPEDQEVAEAVATSTPTSLPPTPSSTATLQATGTPTTTPTLEETIQQIVLDELGNSNRDVDRIAETSLLGQRIYVRWAINDNFTEGLIKGGARLDIYDVAQGLSEAGLGDFDLFMRGSFPLRDIYGDVSEETVVAILLTSETLSRINWENFYSESIYEVADSVELHPTFQP